MNVEIHIFSGQPNPSWELSGGEAQELSKLLRGLIRIKEAPEEEEGLGYRGFVISNPNERAGVPRWVRVCRGTVSLMEQEGIRHYRDVNRIEHWLMELAGSHGYDDIVGEIMK